MRKITKDYMEILDKSSSKISELNQINSDIDCKVYELYGLNKQDRTIIEALIPESDLSHEQINEPNIELPEDEED